MFNFFVLYDNLSFEAIISLGLVCALLLFLVGFVGCRSDCDDNNSKNSVNKGDK